MLLEIQVEGFLVGVCVPWQLSSLKSRKSNLIRLDFGMCKDFCYGHLQRRGIWNTWFFVALIMPFSFSSKICNGRNRTKLKVSLYPQLNTFLEQKPMTYIDDTTAPIGDLNFPSVTICNINQVSFLPIYQSTICNINQVSFYHVQQSIFLPRKTRIVPKWGSFNFVIKTDLLPQQRKSKSWSYLNSDFIDF